MSTIKSYDQISGVYMDYQAQSIKTIRVSNTISALTIVGQNDVGKIADKISKIEFGENIAKIDEYCCANANNLSTVIPSQNVRFVADHAFQNCTKLSSFAPLDNGSTLYCIGNYAFNNTKLKNIKLNIWSDDYNYNYQGCILTDKDHGPYAGHYAFANCTDLTSVKFIKSTEIGAHMFDGCTSLVNVDISGANLSGSFVGEYAFANCKNLKKIVFPYRFEMISKYMFDNCENLTSIVLQDSPNATTYFSDIEDYAFNGCKKLTELSIPASVSDISLFGRNCLANSNISAVYLNGMLSNQFDNFYRLSSYTVTTTVPVQQSSTNTQQNAYPIGKMLGNESYGVYEEAQRTNIPLVVWFCSDNCAPCKWFKNKVASLQAFKDFVATSPYYFAYFDPYKEHGKDIEKMLWHIWYKKANTWQDGHLRFVAFFYIWKNQDGILRIECPDRLGNYKSPEDELNLIKKRCSDYFYGFQLDETKLSETSTKTTSVTQQIVITEESFDAWGVGHECDFYTKDGMIFHYDPTKQLSVMTVDKIEFTGITAEFITAEFVMYGKEGKTDGFKVTYTVPNNISFDDVAPNMYYLGAGSKFDGTTRKSKTKNDSMYSYARNMFTSWSPAKPDTSQSFVAQAQYENPYTYAVFYDNLGNIINVEKSYDAPIYAPQTQPYVFPESVAEDYFADQFKMNTALKQTYINIDKISKISADASSGTVEPELVAWIDIYVAHNNSSTASNGNIKVQINRHAIFPGTQAVKRTTRTEPNTLHLFIPWYSHYYAKSSSGKDIFQKNSNNTWRTTETLNTQNGLVNNIYFDKNTMSIAISTTNSLDADSIIAYYSFHQFFPCKANYKRHFYYDDTITDVSAATFNNTKLFGNDAVKSAQYFSYLIYHNLT